MLASFTCSSVTVMPVVDGAGCCAWSNPTELNMSVAKQKEKNSILFKMALLIRNRQCGRGDFELTLAVVSD
jgi:hypothetical protein